MYECKGINWYLTALKRIYRKLPYKLANYALNQYEKKKIRLRSYPPKLYIEIGNVCNLHCPMCLRRWYRRKEGYMSVDQITYIIKQNPGLIGVGIGGWGEPLLHPNFPEIFRILTLRGILVAFDTNATLINQRFLDTLKEGVLLYKLVISVDSPVTGRIRDYPNPKIVYENIRKIAEIRKRKGYPRILMLSCTVSKSNLNEVENVVRLAYEAGIPKVGAHPTTAFNRKHLEGPYGPPPLEELSKAFRRAEALAKKLGIEFSACYPLVKSWCDVPWTSMFIAWDGTVYPCCMHLKRPLGNVFEHSLREIWNGRKYMEFRRSFREGEEEFCKNCLEGNFHLNCLGIADMGV